MGRRGASDKERLSSIETKLDFICEGINESKAQWKKYNGMDIPRRLNKIDVLAENQKKIDKRITKLEYDIKIIQLAGGAVVSIIAVIFGSFFYVKIDADKIVPLGIIEATNFVNSFIV